MAVVFSSRPFLLEKPKLEGLAKGPVSEHINDRTEWEKRLIKQAIVPSQGREGYDQDNALPFRDAQPRAC